MEDSGRSLAVRLLGTTRSHLQVWKSLDEDEAIRGVMDSFSLHFPPQPGTAGISQLDLEVGYAQVGRSRLQRQGRCLAESFQGRSCNPRQAWWVLAMWVPSAFVDAREQVILNREVA